MGVVKLTKPLATEVGADSPTRERLMREAMKLLATEGFNGVSLRRIVRASGGANPSALHYHFGDRLTLVREIAQMLQSWYEPRALEQLTQLRERSRYRVRDVLEAVFGPVIEMLLDPALGTDAVRFIARLGWDFGHEGQEISAQFHQQSMGLAFKLLRPLMPTVDDEALKFRLVTNMNNVYNGLAYRSYLWRSPFGALDIVKQENAAQLRAWFMDYLEGGLRS
ncbi:MAG: TetR/AcrR family transcriptional regulator [Pseudomonadota bacterium]